MRLALVQPRHVYAHEAVQVKHGQIYFPASAYFAAERFRASGIDCAVYDENLIPWRGTERMVGFACIGSPYYSPISLRLASLREQGVSDLWVGGQGINGLDPAEIELIFGNDVRNTIPQELDDPSKGERKKLPKQEEVSIAHSILSLSESDFATYFSQETPLYLSQGCRFSCTFCGAERARPASVLGPTVHKREIYRDLAGVSKELNAVALRSRRIGLDRSKFYLSNLDLFQSPKQLRGFLDIVREVSSDYPEHKFLFRGLATSTSFMLTHRQNPKIIEEFVDLGLEQVGFGIDGATPEVWRAIRKPHSSDECLEAVAVAREVYGITPEVLMVFGHEGHDNVKSLALAVDTVRLTVEKFGAVPRPHVAKALVPGNDGWYSQRFAKERDFLLSNLWAFQFLDFTCLPTDVTHPDPLFRNSVAAAFLEICNMPTCLTKHVLPEDRRLSSTEYNEAVSFNKGRYDI